MTTDPLALVEDIRTATNRLITSASALDDPWVAGASALPGWTRGHVLTHISRHADGATNLLTWARTGVPTPQYASPDQRGRDIEAGAGRPAAEQLADLRESAGRLGEAFAVMPALAWAKEIQWADGRVGPAALVAWFRLRELELHHVDLAAGYTAEDWPEAFAVRMVTTLARDMAAARIVLRCPEVGHDLTFGEPNGPLISGRVRPALAWLTGRGGGAGLIGALPAVPPFG